MGTAGWVGIRLTAAIDGGFGDMTMSAGELPIGTPPIRPLALYALYRSGWQRWFLPRNSSTYAQWRVYDPHGGFSLFRSWRTVMPCPRKKLSHLAACTSRWSGRYCALFDPPIVADVSHDQRSRRTSFEGGKAQRAEGGKSQQSPAGRRWLRPRERFQRGFLRRPRNPRPGQNLSK